MVLSWIQRQLQLGVHVSLEHKITSYGTLQCSKVLILSLADAAVGQHRATPPPRPPRLERGYARPRVQALDPGSPWLAGIKGRCGACLLLFSVVVIKIFLHHVISCAASKVHVRMIR